MITIVSFFFLSNKSCPVFFQIGLTVSFVQNLIFIIFKEITCFQEKEKPVKVKP